jgi:hypothetical protein
VYYGGSGYKVSLGDHDNVTYYLAMWEISCIFVMVLYCVEPRRGKSISTKIR